LHEFVVVEYQFWSIPEPMADYLCPVFVQILYIQHRGYCDQAEGKKKELEGNREQVEGLKSTVL
jgi:hypothetical protein